MIVINNLTPSHQQIQKIINRSKDHHEKSGNIKLDKQNFDINVQNLSFKYDGKKNFLKTVLSKFLITKSTQ